MGPKSTLPSSQRSEPSPNCKWDTLPRFAQLADVTPTYCPALWTTDDKRQSWYDSSSLLKMAALVAGSAKSPPTSSTRTLGNSRTIDAAADAAAVLF